MVVSRVTATTHHLAQVVNFRADKGSCSPRTWGGGVLNLYSRQSTEVQSCTFTEGASVDSGRLQSRSARGTHCLTWLTVQYIHGDTRLVSERGSVMAHTQRLALRQWGQHCSYSKSHPALISGESAASIGPREGTSSQCPPPVSPTPLDGFMFPAWRTLLETVSESHGSYSALPGQPGTCAA